MKLLKNTTESTHSKLLLTATTDWLKIEHNTTIYGKLNLSFSHMSKEITLSTSMSTITLTGMITRPIHQKPMSKVLNIKSHTQPFKILQEMANQRMNSSNAKTMRSRHSSMLNLQMRRDLP